MANKLPQSFLNKEIKVKNILQSISHIEGLIFKGGTSLSLARGILERFSEDIDLSYDISLNGQKWKQEKINQEVYQSIKNLSWVKNIQINKGVILLEFENKFKRNKFDYIIKPNTIKVELSEKLRHNPVYKFEKIEPYKSANFKMYVATLESTLFDKASIVFEEVLKRGVAKFADITTSFARHLFDINILVDLTKKYTIPKNFLKKRIYENILKKNGELRGKDTSRVKLLIQFNTDKFIKSIIEELKNKKSEIKESIKKLIYPSSKTFNFEKMLKNIARYLKILFEYTKEMWEKNNFYSN